MEIYHPEKPGNKPSKKLLTALGKTSIDIMDDNDQKIEWNKKKEKRTKRGKRKERRVEQKIEET